jgi:hypothetical protein
VDEQEHGVRAAGKGVSKGVVIRDGAVSIQQPLCTLREGMAVIVK